MTKTVSHWQKSYQKLLRLIVKLFKRVYQCYWLLVKLFFKLYQLVSKTLIKNKASFSIIFLVLVFSAIALAGIIPSDQNFEGNLIVRQMNFTYAGDRANNLFLNEIYGINQITATGVQTLTLDGKFESTSEPKLNNLNKLTIEFPTETSQWTIASLNFNELSQLKLLELRLPYNTKVSGLNHNFYPNREIPFNELSLSLKPPIQANQSTNHSLHLDLGEIAIKVTLERYKLPDLGLEASSDNPNPLVFTFTPSIKQIGLLLTHPMSFYISLPDPKKVDFSRWFWGNLIVKDVEFYERVRTGVDVKDEFLKSTILEGKIRMGEQELKIEPEQFLIFPSKDPGIQLLRNLQIQPRMPHIQIRISGKTKRIQVGLDKNFPVSSIQASYLARFLPKDAVIAIVSFCVAMIPWLLERRANAKQEDQR